MTDRPNLAALMKNDAADACDSADLKTYEPDAFAEALRERAASLAENACTYHADCAHIITRYDSDVTEAETADFTSEQRFSPGEWEKAMEAYAYAVARVILEREAGELAEAAEELAGELTETAEKEGADMSELEIGIARDCPYGWSSHNYETANGVCVWRNIEGSRALAVAVSGVWLHVIWTPEAQDAPENH